MEGGDKVVDEQPVMGYCGDAQVTLLDGTSLGNARVMLWRDGWMSETDVAPT